MNNLLRVASRLSFKTLLSPVKKVSNTFQQRQLARNLWYMCNRNESENKLSKLCTCGCMSRHQHAHSKAERELVEFLTEEIVLERKAQKSVTLPAELEGFKVGLNGSEVTLNKKVENETIKITFNVNHTVDSDELPKVDSTMDNPEFGELKSKPEFRIEIVRGSTTFSVLCSFLESDEQEEDSNDIFRVDEISLYDGTWNENVYAVASDVLDTYLYDLILNYLEEKGISNEFVGKLSDFSTSYEHSAYIGLLEGLSKFVSGK
ncbi:complement component 1 Q subcomponent-binding protein, mitochondrial [Tribolium castaneum]|uniref:Complement component 1 Q subcomponent-binding protein, mitochondrial-like Protein n=1 Tax=Tribolium castaneum TaxID=7070 RepID=D2CFW8_TRICA|nr:PREDICTED: complement component 1 Q subcomponent-binding protein, mitochondrial [Tribolium castaneum]EFA13033.1 Complement component 1 Q subcomponent-binding protein, mitochondrial-like Protein [Tribolium castaneum]|eukprot:XP_967206.1 PREDICTED: complement component 1 Q subcomponent-binding protein, mitochondrial [Tribolium castaneum]